MHNRGEEGWGAVFSGIVEATGVVKQFARSREGGDLVVEAPRLQVRAGESVAVDGACLTAVRSGRGRLAARLSPETLARTSLGLRRAGEAVNLERALRLGDRLGGHFVLGHIDTAGRVGAMEHAADCAWLTVLYEPRFDSWVVEKGSLAVNGVSLTIAACARGRASFALIPYTLETTNLGRLQVGQHVNLEFDYLAKLVAAQTLRPRPAPRARRSR